MGDPIRLEQEEAEQIEKALHSFYGICVTAHQEHLCTTALSLLAAARERAPMTKAHFKPLPDPLPLAPETQIASGYSYDLRGLEPALERADTARLRASIKAAMDCAREWSQPDVADGEMVPPHTLAEWVQHAEARHFRAALAQPGAKAPRGREEQK